MFCGPFFRLAPSWKRLQTLGRVCLVLGGGLLSACTTVPETLAVPEPMYPPPPGYAKVGKPYTVSGVTYHPRHSAEGYVEEGIASWYGQRFQGGKTANGEQFDMNTLSAAHTTLPLPVHVRVTNLKNDRWALVRVNDRGPFVKNRLLDLSMAAAKLLGFDKQGTTRVRVEDFSAVELSLDTHSDTRSSAHLKATASQRKKE